MKKSYRSHPVRRLRRLWIALWTFTALPAKINHIITLIRAERRPDVPADSVAVEKQKTGYTAFSSRLLPVRNTQ